MSRGKHLAFVVLLSFSAAPVIGAQRWLSKLTDKAKEVAAKKIEERVTQGANDGTQAALDAAEGGIRCLFTDPACIKKAKDEGKPAVLVNQQGAAVNPQGVVVKDTTTKSAASPMTGGPGGVTPVKQITPGQPNDGTDDEASSDSTTSKGSGAATLSAASKTRQSKHKTTTPKPNTTP